MIVLSRWHDEQSLQIDIRVTHECGQERDAESGASGDRLSVHTIGAIDHTCLARQFAEQLLEPVAFVETNEAVLREI